MKKRSSKTPIYDPHIQVDGNLVDVSKRGRLMSSSNCLLPERPFLMHNYELHLSASEQRELELVLLVPDLALFYSDGSFTDLDPKGLELYPKWKAGFAWAQFRFTGCLPSSSDLIGEDYGDVRTLNFLRPNGSNLLSDDVDRASCCAAEIFGMLTIILQIIRTPALFHGPTLIRYLSW